MKISEETKFSVKSHALNYMKKNDKKHKDMAIIFNITRSSFTKRFNKMNNVEFILDLCLETSYNLKYIKELNIK